MTIVKSSELRRELTVGEVAERSGVAVGERLRDLRSEEHTSELQSR